MEEQKRRRITASAVAAAVLLVAAAVCITVSGIRKRDAGRRTVQAMMESSSLVIGGERLKPTGSIWQSEGLGEFVSNEDEKKTITVRSLDDTAIELPDFAAAASVRLEKDGEDIYSGSPDGLPKTFPENGEYELRIEVEIDASVESERGDSFHAGGREVYLAKVRYDIPMQFSFAADTVKQGSAIAIKGTGVRGKVTVSAGKVADPFELTVDRLGNAVGILSISYITDPGRYTALIETENGDETFEFTVQKEDYSVQHLVIDTEVQSSTVGNSGNQAEYQKMLRKTYASWYPTRFFDGCFTQPIEGTVTTEFGLYRYTNDNPYPTRHVGVDIANAEGTPVLAAADGYVIVSGFFGTSGNTVVIDHGLGVRTYYYHMSDTAVSEGDFVREGTVIGYVGSTGYANGPHLHFNVMVHENSIDPWPTFDGTSGIFGVPD